MIKLVLLLLGLAVANKPWAVLAVVPVLAVVTGPEAYISPAWYDSKAEHGKVVPTWNYSAVHFTGRVTAHHDADWLLGLVAQTGAAYFTEDYATDERFVHQGYIDEAQYVAGIVAAHGDNGEGVAGVAPAAGEADVHVDHHLADAARGLGLGRAEVDGEGEERPLLDGPEVFRRQREKLLGRR